jgi:hypothetical protein
MNYLRFPDQETALSVLQEANLTYTNPETGEIKVITASHTHAIDVIGDIYTSGVYDIDIEGTPITVDEPIKLDGYHINMIGEIYEELKDYIIEPPQTPYRVFAGYQ